MKLLVRLLISFVVVFIVTSTYAATDLYWSADGVNAGGAGTWNTSGVNFGTTSGGPYTRAWTNANVDSLILDGVAGTITVGANVTVNRITNTVAGFTFAGSSRITFSGTGAGLDHPNTATKLSFANTIGGTSFTKTGAGRVELGNNGNTVTRYIVLGGVLTTANTNKFGPASGATDFLTLDNGAGWGTDSTSQNLGVNRGIYLNSGGGSIGTLSATVTNTVHGRVTGPGSLSFPAPIYFSAGTWILTNPTNDYAGSTFVKAGTLRLGASEVLPNTTYLQLTTGGSVALDGATETVSRVLVNSSTATISGSGSLIATNFDLRSSGTISAVLAGAGATLVKSTAGTVDLSGANTFTGGAAINVGTLRVNNNAALGSAGASVTLANGVTLATTGGTARSLNCVFTVNGDITIGQVSGGTAALTLAGWMNLGGGVRSLKTDNATDTISGVITNGGLIKVGAGTLQLTGANTYADGTTVNEGLLVVSGSNICSGATLINAGKLITTAASVGAGSYSVADGASLGVVSLATAGSLAMSDLTVGNSTMEFDLAHLAFPAARMVTNWGALTVNGTVAVDVKGFDTTGTTTLLEYAGPRGGGGSFTTGAMPPRVSASIFDDTANNRVILNSTAADSLVWVGDAFGNWDVNSGTPVWKLAVAGTPTDYQENTVQGDTVRFDDTAAGTANVFVAVPVSPYSITIVNSATNYSFIGTGKITGGGTLTKSGNGELTITTGNDYTGGTTLNGGVVNVGTNTAFGTGKLTINGSVIIRSDGSTARSLSVATDLNGSATLGDAVNIGDLTFSGVIAGPGSLTKVGSGMLSLSGANTFTGGVSHNAGTLRVNSTTALGAANSTVNLADGVTLSTTTTTARTLTYVFNVNGDIDLGQTTGGTAAVTLAGWVNLGGANRTFNLITNAGISAVITNGGLTKLGTGTLTLTGNNLYTGDTTNSQGFISLNNTVATPFGAASGTIYLTGGGIATSSGNRDTVPILNPLVMLADTTFQGDTAGAGYRNFPINGQVTTVAGILTVKNTGTANGIWHPRFHAGGMSFTRPIIIGVGGDTGGTQLSSYNTNGGGDQTFIGVISGTGVFGRGAAVAGTGGKTILTAANTYSGGTLVSDGTLLVNNTTGSGTGSGTVSVYTNGVLGGTGTIGGTVVVTNGGSINAGASAGTLTLTNGLNLSANGTNIFELAANTTSGAGANFDQIAVTGGTVVLGGSARLCVKFIGTATFPDATNSFWQATRTWKVISLSGSASNPGATVFSGVDGAAGNNAGTFSTTADASGVYLVFTPGVAAPLPSINSLTLNGSSLIFGGTNGIAGHSYRVLSSTNVGLARTNWTPEVTNVFGPSGTFSVTNAIAPGVPHKFYSIDIPLP